MSQANSPAPTVKSVGRGQLMSISDINYCLLFSKSTHRKTQSQRTEALLELKAYSFSRQYTTQNARLPA